MSNRFGGPLTKTWPTWQRPTDLGPEGREDETFWGSGFSSGGRFGFSWDVFISPRISCAAALWSVCIFNEAVASVQLQAEQDLGGLS